MNEQKRISKQERSETQDIVIGKPRRSRIPKDDNVVGSVFDAVLGNWTTAYRKAKHTDKKNVLSSIHQNLVSSGCRFLHAEYSPDGTYYIQITEEKSIMNKIRREMRKKVKAQEQEEQQQKSRAAASLLSSSGNTKKDPSTHTTIKSSATDLSMNALPQPDLKSSDSLFSLFGDDITDELLSALAEGGNGSFKALGTGSMPVDSHDVSSKTLVSIVEDKLSQYDYEKMDGSANGAESHDPGSHNDNVGTMGFDVVLPRKKTAAITPKTATQPRRVSDQGNTGRLIALESDTVSEMTENTSRGAHPNQVPRTVGISGNESTPFCFGLKGEGQEFATPSTQQHFTKQEHETDLEPFNSIEDSIITDAMPKQDYSNVAVDSSRRISTVDVSQRAMNGVQLLSDFMSHFDTLEKKVERSLHANFKARFNSLEQRVHSLNQENNDLRQQLVMYKQENHDLRERVAILEYKAEST